MNKSNVTPIKYPPTTVDPNTETSDDTPYKPLAIVGGLDDALGTLDNAYKTNDRTPPTRTAYEQGRDTRPSPPWRGLTINNVAFCVYIIETFLSTPRRNRTEFKDFIQLDFSHHASIPKQVFTPAVIDAINTVYRETSFGTSAEVFHYTNRVGSMIVKVGSEEHYRSCRIVSELLNEMYLVLKSHQQY
jgi:hypothetical protein